MSVTVKCEFVAGIYYVADDGSDTMFCIRGSNSGNCSALRGKCKVYELINRKPCSLDGYTATVTPRADADAAKANKRVTEHSVAEFLDQTGG